MALVWLLKDPRVTSVLIGASSVQQLDDNVSALKNMKFTDAELKQIEEILSNKSEPAQPNLDEKTPSRGDFIQNLAKRFERK